MNKIFILLKQLKNQIKKLCYKMGIIATSVISFVDTIFNIFKFIIK